MSSANASELEERPKAHLRRTSRASSSRARARSRGSPSRPPEGEVPRAGGLAPVSSTGLQLVTLEHGSVAVDRRSPEGPRRQLADSSPSSSPTASPVATDGGRPTTSGALNAAVRGRRPGARGPGAVRGVASRARSLVHGGDDIWEDHLVKRRGVGAEKDRGLCAGDRSSGFVDERESNGGFGPRSADGWASDRRLEGTRHRGDVSIKSAALRAPSARIFSASASPLARMAAAYGTDGGGRGDKSAPKTKRRSVPGDLGFALGFDEDRGRATAGDGLELLGLGGGDGSLGEGRLQRAIRGDGRDDVDRDDAHAVGGRDGVGLPPTNSGPRARSLARVPSRDSLSLSLSLSGDRVEDGRRRR